MGAAGWALPDSPVAPTGLPVLPDCPVLLGGSAHFGVLSFVRPVEWASSLDLFSGVLECVCVFPLCFGMVCSLPVADTYLSLRGEFLGIAF